MKMEKIKKEIADILIRQKKDEVALENLKFLMDKMKEGQDFFEALPFLEISNNLENIFNDEDKAREEIKSQLDKMNPQTIQQFHSDLIKKYGRRKTAFEIKLPKRIKPNTNKILGLWKTGRKK